MQPIPSHERAGTPAALKRPACGVIGVGAIGAGIARCLLRAGFSCSIYDTDARKLPPLTELGAKACSSPAEVAKLTDLLFLAPFNAAQVESILTEHGALATLPKHATVVVLSTMPPSDAIRFAELAAAHGHVLIDCPVSGGGQAAAEGKLTLMIGGPSHVLERYRPAFEAFAGKIFHVGERPGSGAAVKLVNQALYFTHLASLAEVVAFAERTGVDLTTMLEVVSASSGDSWALRHRLPTVIDRSYRDQGSIEISAKDLGSILRTAAEAKVPMPVTALARQLFEMARAAHPEGCDDVALVALMEQLADAHR